MQKKKIVVVLKFLLKALLEFNQYWGYGKTPSIIYGDREYLIKGIDRCKNDLKNRPQQK